jgi:hypothetical protein
MRILAMVHFICEIGLQLSCLRKQASMLLPEVDSRFRGNDSFGFVKSFLNHPEFCKHR